jgi:NADH dehydrogenase
MPYTIIQSSIMFGEGDEFLNNLAGVIRAALIVPIIGSGRNRFQPIAVEDVARCLAQAVDREDLKGKTVEIGGPEQLSYNEIVSVVARTLDKRRFRIHVPMWAMYLPTAILQRVLPRSPVTTDLLRMLAIRNVAETGAVENAFGFTPRTMEGNIDFVRLVGFWDGVKIALGTMPARIRDH